MQPAVSNDIVKFGLVGVVSTSTDFLMLNLFVHFGLTIYWAIFFAYFIGAVIGYLLNNGWTYRRLNQKHSFAGFFRYAVIAFIGLGLTESVVYALFHAFHTPINLDKLVAVAVVFAWNFLANRFFTFRPDERAVAG